MSQAYPATKPVPHLLHRTLGQRWDPLQLQLVPVLWTYRGDISTSNYFDLICRDHTPTSRKCSYISYNLHLTSYKIIGEKTWKDKLLYPNAPVWKCFCHRLPHCTEKGVHTIWHAAGPRFGLSNSQVGSYRNSTFQSVGPNPQDRCQTPRSNSLTKEAVRSHWSITINSLMHLSSGKKSHQTIFGGIHSNTLEIWETLLSSKQSNQAILIWFGQSPELLEEWCNILVSELREAWGSGT